MRKANERRARRTGVAGLGLTALAFGSLVTIAPAGAVVGPDVPMVAIGDALVREGDSGRQVAKVPITLSRPIDGDAFFLVQTSSDPEKSGGTADVDYKSVTKAVRIPSGATSKSVGIPIYGDTVEETREFVDLVITPLDAPDVGFTDSKGSVIIEEDEPDAGEPTVSVSSSRLYEGPGSRAVQLTLALSEKRASDVYVTWHTEGGTATPGADYKPVHSKTTRIPAGKMQKTVTVLLYGDITVEPDEDFNVLIDSATGGDGVHVGAGRGQVFVVDDDGDDDADGLTNAAERFYKTDKDDPDSDDDGIPDFDEAVIWRTNPNQVDTDEDGYDDLNEIKSGSDPNDPNSIPSV